MGLIFQMEKFSWVFRNGWGKQCVKFYMKTYFLPLSPFKLLNIKQTQKAFYKICVFLFQSKFGKPAKVWIWETAKRSIKHWRRPSLITHISPFTPSLRYSAVVRTTRLEGTSLTSKTSSYVKQCCRFTFTNISDSIWNAIRFLVLAVPPSKTDDSNS